MNKSNWETDIQMNKLIWAICFIIIINSNKCYLLFTFLI